jgi:pimeloyl-ACP methyl ester carboxylesterase
VGGGAWSWAPQVEAFAAAGPIYAWEARGHGAAARVADAGLSDYHVDADEALSLVRTREERAPVLVGHSMGGLLALALAAHRPADIAGLVLVDPVYAEENEGHVAPAFRPLAHAMVAPLVGSLARGGAITNWIARSMFFASFRDPSAAARWWDAQRAQVPFEYPRMVFEGIDGVEQFSLEGLADTIDVPTLVLNGRFSRMAQRLRARLGERFETDTIPGGHYLQLDRPDAVNERLRRFLGEHVAA